MHLNFSFIYYWHSLFHFFSHQPHCANISLMKFSFFLTSRLNGIRRRERELEKGVDEGGWIEYWIRVVNFIGNQKYSTCFFKALISDFELNLLRFEFKNHFLRVFRWLCITLNFLFHFSSHHYKLAEETNKHADTDI